MKPILEVQHISKKFRIKHLTGNYLSLRERITDAFSGRRETSEDLWALDDLSFSVEKGDSIGIIGRNGAGKSTLLKVLSRITPPTRGRIVVRGRLASLLEVGTGFHQELTGRENIFFNGSLLNMKRREIEAKFDEIVDFSGTERFLDTPLKHYSSGMQLRLAFAVAAFLEPEIVVIDEVLAVGDAEFQKKCLGKMEDVKNSGRTILFVSHQLGMVRQLCKHSFMLDAGKIVHHGKTEDVVAHYTQFVSSRSEFVDDGRLKNKQYTIQKVRPFNASGRTASSFAHDEEILLEMDFSASTDLNNTHLLVAVCNNEGRRIFSADTPLSGYRTGQHSSNRVVLSIPSETLTPGNYSFYVAIHCPNTVSYDTKEQVCPISVFDNGSSFVQYENRWFYGDVFVDCKWDFAFKEDHSRVG